MSSKKIFKTHIHNINTLVSLCLASAKVKRLMVEQENGIYDMRPQLHLVLRAPTGSVKSTILNVIGNQVGADVNDEITSPGLVGTIDSKAMQLIPGSAWLCRNSLMLIDEFRFRRKTSDWQIFLKLLEDRKFSKKIGLFSVPQEELDDDLILRVKNGQIFMKTRFSAVIATMKRFESQKSDDFKAFITRCLCYEYNFDIPDMNHILSGRKFLDIKPPKVAPEITVKKSKYFQILRFVRKEIGTSVSSRDNFARTVGDITRIHAITGNMNKRLYRDIINWKLNTYSKIGRYSGRD